MQDLTKIEKPFGLLDPETKKALREYEGEVEVYISNAWQTPVPSWCSHLTYRAKPQPPKPREWWLNVYAGGTASPHDTKAEADKYATTARLACVRVREVLEDAR